MILALNFYPNGVICYLMYIVLLPSLVINFILFFAPISKLTIMTIGLKFELPVIIFCLIGLLYLTNCVLLGLSIPMIKHTPQINLQVMYIVAYTLQVAWMVSHLA